MLYRQRVSYCNMCGSYIALLIIAWKRHALAPATDVGGEVEEGGVQGPAGAVESPQGAVQLVQDHPLAARGLQHTPLRLGQVVPGTAQPAQALTHIETQIHTHIYAKYIYKHTHIQYINTQNTHTHKHTHTHT